MVPLWVIWNIESHLNICICTYVKLSINQSREVPIVVAAFFGFHLNVHLGARHSVNRCSHLHPIGNKSQLIVITRGCSSFAKATSPSCFKYRNFDQKLGASTTATLKKRNCVAYPTPSRRTNICRQILPYVPNSNRPSLAVTRVLDNKLDRPTFFGVSD